MFCALAMGSIAHHFGTARVQDFARGGVLWVCLDGSMSGACGLIAILCLGSAIWMLRR